MRKRLTRAVEEQLQRAETLARLLASARTALKAGRTPDAARALSEARVIDPDAPELNDLAAAIRAAIEKEEKALRTREEIRDALGRATKRLAKRDFAGALALVDEVLARDPQHADALELRAEVTKPGSNLSLPASSSACLQSSVVVGRVTGGLILAAAVGFVVYQQVSRPDIQSDLRTELPGKPATDPSPSAAQGSRGPTPAPEPSREPENPVVRDSRVASAERRAVQQVAAGKPRRAMDYIKEGLGIAPDDPGLRKLRRDIRRHGAAGCGSGAAQGC